MPEAIKSALRRWSHRGMYWPFVHDPERQKPSVTLMFFYISFMLSVLAISASSILLFVKGDFLTATFMPTLLATMGFVFYRLRNLDKVKFDLNDQQIELSSSDEEETEGK